MILSTQTDYLSRKFGIEKSIDIIADSGFDAIDLTLFDMKTDSSVFCRDNYKELAKSLKKKHRAGDFSLIRHTLLFLPLKTMLNTMK